MTVRYESLPWLTRVGVQATGAIVSVICDRARACRGIQSGPEAGDLDGRHIEPTGRAAKRARKRAAG